MPRKHPAPHTAVGQFDNDVVSDCLTTIAHRWFVGDVLVIAQRIIEFITLVNRVRDQIFDVAGAVKQIDPPFVADLPVGFQSAGFIIPARDQIEMTERRVDFKAELRGDQERTHDGQWVALQQFRVAAKCTDGDTHESVGRHDLRQCFAELGRFGQDAGDCRVIDRRGLFAGSVHRGFEAVVLGGVKSGAHDFSFLGFLRFRAR